MEVKLIMFKSDGQRKDFPIINPTTVIGRGENCDLRVPLLNVSRRHCELMLSGDVVKVKDVASSNGTFVNNKRVNETILNPGDPPDRRPARGHQAGQDQGRQGRRRR
jgi:pSer/pThr/pTyr-binding forkhead associated (FHA) protein